MSLRQALSQFDEKDVRALNEALKKFSEYTKYTGAPDWSNVFVAYTPVLAFALLRSQGVLERLTKILIGLTVVLAFLTLLLAVDAIRRWVGA